MDRVAQQQWLLGEDQQRRLDLYQFYTPAHVAERMWEWSRRPGLPHERVCEPSAGRGSLVLPMYGRSAPKDIVAYDVDPLNVRRLELIALPLRPPSSSEPTLEVRARDFTEDLDPGRFDLFLMNPPYEDDQDIDHLDHAMDHAPSVIALVRSVLVHGQGRWNKFWRHADIRRRANLVERPQFSVPTDGRVPTGAKSDFVVLDIERRHRARRQGEASTQTEEWWSWS